ncbi:hypothetical protein [Rhodopirellula sp. SWK7]|uniref:hypothetical protein n=1 Tax=Rhodopirellula sp. SWK7 TaxID=595460 RepID=UPI0002C010EA|nr:hypothetical protein [Rhodopirellula sp. SWK7]EMI44004.1 hypothetical protein RRSWK_03487 [Rhodopirellula sp. SWK7]
MNQRGYFLLMTPLDLHATSDQLVRNYELVRRKIAEIAPSLPSDAEIDIFSGGTPHNADDIPLLGLHLPERSDRDNICDALQEQIDGWFCQRSRSDLDAMLAEIDYPLWSDIQRIRSYPDRRCIDADNCP